MLEKTNRAGCEDKIRSIAVGVPPRTVFLRTTLKTALLAVLVQQDDEAGFQDLEDGGRNEFYKLRRIWLASSMLQDRRAGRSGSTSQRQSYRWGTLCSENSR